MLVSKALAGHPLGRPRRRSENGTEMGLLKLSFEDDRKIELPQENVQGGCPRFSDFESSGSAVNYVNI
jgi:hypothetical protein